MRTKTLIVCLDKPTRLICSNTFELKELAKPKNLMDVKAVWGQYILKLEKAGMTKKKHALIYEELQALKKAIEKAKK